jgi:hypothetical protein
MTSILGFPEGPGSLEEIAAVNGVVDLQLLLKPSTVFGLLQVGR